MNSNKYFMFLVLDSGICLPTKFSWRRQNITQPWTMIESVLFCSQVGYSIKNNTE